MKLILMVLAVLVFTSCSSITMQRGEKGTASYVKVKYTGPQKDFRDVDYRFGDDIRLRAGEAITAEQPWTDITADGIDVARALLFCRQNPGMCK